MPQRPPSSTSSAGLRNHLVIKMTGSRHHDHFDVDRSRSFGSTHTIGALTSRLYFRWSRGAGRDRVRQGPKSVSEPRVHPPRCTRCPVPMQDQAPPPKTGDFDQPPDGCAAPTALQPSLQAASTSMGAAFGSATVLASPARSPAR